MQASGNDIFGKQRPGYSQARESMWGRPIACRCRNKRPPRGNRPGSSDPARCHLVSLIPNCQRAVTELPAES